MSEARKHRSYILRNFFPIKGYCISEETGKAMPLVMDTKDYDKDRYIAVTIGDQPTVWIPVQDIVPCVKRLGYYVNKHDEVLY